MGRQAEAATRGAFMIIGVLGGPVLFFGGGALLHAIFG